MLMSKMELMQTFFNVSTTIELNDYVISSIHIHSNLMRIEFNTINSNYVYSVIFHEDDIKLTLNEENDENEENIFTENVELSTRMIDNTSIILDKLIDNLRHFEKKYC